MAKRKGSSESNSMLKYSVASGSISSSSASDKVSKEKSRVELRYYENSEFYKLTNSQKKELSE